MHGEESVLIVEDDPRLSGLLRACLEPSGYTVREASSGEEALAAAREEPPALVVLDVGLPGISGYTVCNTLRADLGDRVGILIVSGTRTDGLDRVAGLLIGADDYLVKPFPLDEFVARARALLRRTAPAAAPSPADLTPREREILCLLADGLDQRAIADRLVISSKTVGTHIEHILLKLDVHSRAQAVAKAYRDGLLLSRR